ncbi:BQ5605_C031g10912 [Microbotryum silenes-dioicae]|uniref:tRNA pseudouridine(55) synthase n=1 Tax=Microbotryum silenes-dioicae TaxID=796604 RepID=A0A2X0ML03_9BASI|nr:BQ5605_C031g10912 [Microbotryum silenes-dioicae]
MPKARSKSLSCLFAINKPSGQVSMQLLNQLQPLFASSSLFKPGLASTPHPNDKTKRRKWKQERVKMGQGGTLDPLADGVLVIGVNDATKQLSKFLDCTKEYRAIGLLGCSTDSYDSDGKRVKLASFDGITRDKIEGVLGKFRGEIEQIPPMQMDGKPLYEYARTNTPLPRPIAARKTTIHALQLLNFTPGNQHSYEYPAEELDEQAKLELGRLEKMVSEGSTIVPSEPAEPPTATPFQPESGSALSTRPPTFEISLTVSSGTYVRSIIHDIAIALGSRAHVVKLTRTRQGQFVLDVPSPAGSPASEEAVEGEARAVEEGTTLGCVQWETLEAAIKAFDANKQAGTKPAPASEEADYAEWEKEILSKCKE